jgi:hypothetical protein
MALWQPQAHGFCPQHGAMWAMLCRMLCGPGIDICVCAVAAFKSGKTF